MSESTAMPPLPPVGNEHHSYGVPPQPPTAWSPGQQAAHPSGYPVQQLDVAVNQHHSAGWPASPNTPSTYANDPLSSSPDHNHWTERTVVYRRGQGSTRAQRPDTKKTALNTSSTSRSTAAPRHHFPILPVVATAAITALVVGAGAELIDRVVEPPSAQVDQVSPGQVYGGGSPDGWTEVAKSAGASVVSVQAAGDSGRSQGSGVVWDDNGHIVTNHHVIAPSGTASNEISIAIGNHAYRATLVGSDPATDLAVLKVENLPEAVHPIAKANVDEVAIGDEVMAIGSPLGLDGSYTTGIVSALDRPVSTGAQRDQSVVTNAIQTSAPLNPGNSGGALVNVRGELVGINSSIATLGGAKSGSIGIGFAIPGDLVANVADALIQDGKVAHAWLGVSAVDGEQPVGNGAMQMGAEIASVDESGPGKAAGLQKGDLIVRIGTTDITSATQLVGEVRTYKAGVDVTVTVLRAGQPMDVRVTLGTSPTLG